jgi:hypothetical protein
MDGQLVPVGEQSFIVCVQMQGAGGTSARLDFSGVRRVTFNYERDVSPAVGKALDQSTWEVELLALRIVAEECAVSLTGSAGLGEGPSIGGR